MPCRIPRTFAARAGDGFAPLPKAMAASVAASFECMERLPAENASHLPHSTALVCDGTELSRATGMVGGQVSGSDKDGAGSAGRIRTCDQPVNSRLLYR